MVSHCANPDCRAPFLYFRNGKLFAIPRKTALKQERAEFFWLCGECAAHLQMEITPNSAMSLVPRPQTAVLAS